MPSILKTIVLSAVFTGPMALATAPAPANPAAKVSVLDEIIKMILPQLDDASRKAIRPIYTSYVHQFASIAHGAITDDLKLPSSLQADPNMTTFVSQLLETNMKSIAEAKNIHDALAAGHDFTENLKGLLNVAGTGATPALDVVKTISGITFTSADDQKKFDDRATILVNRAVEAIRTLVETSTECALGLCDMNLLNEIAEKKAEEGAKNAPAQTPAPVNAPTAEDALKILEKMVVAAETFTAEFHSATRVGVLERKNKEADAARTAIALGLGLGLGLGLPIVFAVVLTVLFKTERLVWNRV